MSHPYVHNSETLECVFDQRRHRSNAACDFPIGCREKASIGCMQLALAALANRTSPSAYHNIFFRPFDSRGVALVKQARSGLAWHEIHYSLQVADSTRAFCAVSSAQPPPTCLLFTSAISNVQSPARARDRRVMLPYSNIAGANMEKLAAK